MAFFLVNQGQAYTDERAGNYIWSPKLNKSLQPYREYGPTKEVKEVNKGDYVLHYVDDRILAISIVQEEGKPQNNPQIHKSDHKENEDEEGWIAKTKYYDFDIPLLHSDCIEWLNVRSNNRSPGPFKRNGEIYKGYLYRLPPLPANYLLKKSLDLQTNTDVLCTIKYALHSVSYRRMTKEEQVEYLDSCFSIDELKSAANSGIDDFCIQTDLTTTQFVRNIYVAEYAKRIAKGKCDLCGKRAPFKDKYKKPYLEEHHVIWLSQGGTDTIDNTVALCPNCHRKMHVVANPNDVKKLMRIAIMNSR